MASREEDLKNLERLGNEIIIGDSIIVEYLVNRWVMVMEVERIKRRLGMPIYRPEVEMDRLNKIREIAEKDSGGYRRIADFIVTIYKMIMLNSSVEQMIQREEATARDAKNKE